MIFNFDFYTTIANDKDTRNITGEKKINYGYSIIIILINNQQLFSLVSYIIILY